MLLYRLLVSGALFAAAIAELNVTAVLQLPQCSLKCSQQIVTPSGCAVGDLETCLCTNVTLQTALGACVVDSCNITEQALASTITRKYICNDAPVESRSKEVVRNSIILAAITYPFILLRFITRIKITRELWWDDWIILIAAVFMIPNTFSPIYSAYYGFGKHFWDVDAANYTLLIKLFYASSVCYVILQNIPKLSILFLYLRVFPTPSFVRIVKLVILFVLLEASIYTIMVIFSCIPVDSIWDLSKSKARKCLNNRAMTLSGAGISIALDLVIMSLPVLELRFLQMELKKKIAFAFMFAVGSFGCITAMVRLKYINKYFSKSIDSTWYNVDVVLWSDIETYVATIFACLMCLRPLVIKLLPSFLYSTPSSSYISGASSDAPKPILLRNSYSRFKENESNNDKQTFKQTQEFEREHK